MLTWCSDNDVVDRAFQAVVMIYQLTSRVPTLIRQSHLERNEGKHFQPPALPSIKLIHIQHGWRIGRPYSKPFVLSVSIRVEKSGIKRFHACKTHCSRRSWRLQTIRNGQQSLVKSSSH